ncbi:MAG: hydrogenase maturation protease [Chloroflexi bacterium]|nr:hydrogenase maturation protease [Chloroflexota bacterium]
MTTLVLGIGQSLRGDDAAGLEAVRLWQGKYPQTAKLIRVETSELPGLGLLDLLNGVDAAILVDAVQSAAPAGSLLRVGAADLASFAPDALSAHGWGVAETLQLGRSIYPWLEAVHVTLIGIVGEQFEIGAGLSPRVRAALDGAAAMIESEVHSLI